MLKRKKKLPTAWVAGAGAQHVHGRPRAHDGFVAPCALRFGPLAHAPVPARGDGPTEPRGAAGGHRGRRARAARGPVEARRRGGEARRGGHRVLEDAAPRARRGPPEPRGARRRAAGARRVAQRRGLARRQAAPRGARGAAEGRAAAEARGAGRDALHAREGRVAAARVLRARGRARRRDLRRARAPVHDQNERALDPGDRVEARLALPPPHRERLRAAPGGRPRRERRGGRLRALPARLHAHAAARGQRAEQARRARRGRRRGLLPARRRQGRKRVRNSQLQRLLSRLFSTRFG